MSDWFECKDCHYQEMRKAPSWVKVSETPCPECGGKMVRKD